MVYSFTWSGWPLRLCSTTKRRKSDKRQDRKKYGLARIRSSHRNTSSAGMSVRRWDRSGLLIMFPHSSDSSVLITEESEHLQNAGSPVSARDLFWKSLLG